MRLTGDSLSCKSLKGENGAIFAEVDSLSCKQRLHRPGATVFLSLVAGCLVLGRKGIHCEQGRQSQETAIGIDEFKRL